jgi:DNA-binding response OmpR family regulator
MPLLSGLELSQPVRELDPELPVMLLTGFADDALEHASPLGLAAVVSKPFRIDELLKRVEQCLRASRADGSIRNA